jgi:hypothetical protein
MKKINNLKDHIYYFDEICIGLTTTSLLYSYIFNTPIIFKHKSKTRFFEFVDNSVNLTKTGMLKENKQLNFPKGKYVKAYSKSKVMDHIFMIQSLGGNIPFKDGVSEIHLDEQEKLLKISTKNQRIIKYSFNKLRIFDTRDLNFLNPLGESQEKQYVLDEFKIQINNKKFYDIIPLDINFPRTIHISKDKKTLFSESYLTLAEMNFPDFSSFFITKSIERELNKLGMKVKLEWMKRHYDIKDKYEYEDGEWLIIDKRNEEEIWKERKINTYRTWLGSFRSRMVQRMMDSLGQNV